MSNVAAAPQTEAHPGESRSTHFLFEHKVFAMPDVSFCLTSDTREPALFLSLGDLRVAITLPILYHEFDIVPGSKDAELLGIVARALHFVKEIRPKDSIPREILDGTASWSVEERHWITAKGRLTLRLASWLAGEAAANLDATALEQMADDPNLKQKVDEAFGEIAEQLGIGRDRRKEVVDCIDDLAREFSYIEALRERHGRVTRIFEVLNQLVQVYRTDRAITQEISRVRTLLLRPQHEFEALFVQADAMTNDVLGLLKAVNATIESIRDLRDRLHTTLMLWDEIIQVWTPVHAVRGQNAEQAIKEIYRFAARNFPQRKVWRSGTK